MEIDFSVMQPTMNELAMHVVMILLVPFIVVMFVVEILKMLKIPGFIAGPGASFLLLYLVYQMFLIRF